MEYIGMLFLLIISIHPLSYAKYNWGKKNKLGAVGAILLAILAVVLPTLFIILR